MPYDLPDRATFLDLAAGRNLIPVFRRLTSDQLTPVLAYRRLVQPDDRMAPSFLLESVVGGDRAARYSYFGARPVAQIIARGREVQIRDAIDPQRSRRFESDNPLMEMDRLTEGLCLAQVKDMPPFGGGWVGYAGYDTVRYVEGEKLPAPPPDDRHLPDLHMQLYRDVIAFDHVQKTVQLITHVLLEEHPTPQQAYEAGCARLDDLAQRIETPASVDGRSELGMGHVDLASSPPALPPGNLGSGGFQRMVEAAKRYIEAGDIFQVVLSQRFELLTQADPFDIYRALRVVNPSPYMFYLQIDGGMLVGSSPEILCRVEDGVVTNRPLAGTRRRGGDDVEDRALEAELLADPKERAEHVMLVDLGRNDVGRVAAAGSIRLPQTMAIERYSHVMHISSTVTGRLKEACNCWDALRHTLPVGTVSGAPKVRAMQIIDEQEPVRRGPYAGGVGCADFTGNMDMAIALRTMVIMPVDEPGRGWKVHLQAGAGIVAESVAETEHRETISKAAALAKAVDLAEKSFVKSTEYRDR